MRWSRSTAFVLAAAGALACNSNFEAQSQIARVRVLGVRSEPAELVIPLTPGPGSVPPIVHLEALAVAPEGRPVAVEFAFCRPFANVYAADFECPGKDGVSLRDGGLSLLDPAIVALLTRGDGGVQTGDPLADPLVAGQLAQGLALQVGYLATDGTEGERGVERGYASVTLRRTDVPNHNPTLIDIEADGGTLEGRVLPRATQILLSPVLAPDAQERITTPDGGQSLESISLSWFASGDARIANLRSAILPSGLAKSTTALTTPDAGGVTTLWVVARDGRGGTAWVERTFSSQ
jgi:hypothetical protein